MASLYGPAGCSALNSEKRRFLARAVTCLSSPRKRVSSPVIQLPPVTPDGSQLDSSRRWRSPTPRLVDESDESRWQRAPSLVPARRCSSMQQRFRTQVVHGSAAGNNRTSQDHTGRAALHMHEQGGLSSRLSLYPAPTTHIRMGEYYMHRRRVESPPHASNPLPGIPDPASLSGVLIDRLTTAFSYKGPPDSGLRVWVPRAGEQAQRPPAAAQAQEAAGRA
jgi:hypothetical protein